MTFSFDPAEVSKQLLKAESFEQLETIFEQYLWKKWELTLAFRQMKDVPNDQKKAFGQQLSEAKQILTQSHQQRFQELQTAIINNKLQQDIVDLSLFLDKKVWHYSLLAKARRQLEDICQSMWFLIVNWYDVVTKYENFESVNIPLTHPATDMHDTFYLDQKDSRGEHLVLRTQTSAMQNAIMKQYGVPLKVVVPGRVYRYEDMDASHDTMFYQLEWMFIDKNVSIGNAKKMLTDLLSALFGFEVGIRMRPWYFPFVEPGFEIDATCPLCQWKWCWLCKKTWWIEILWAWMIHPNVLKQWWIDSEERTWFAFGIWVSRLVAIKYAIWDIRLFTNWDLRFARSFD